MFLTKTVSLYTIEYETLLHNIIKKMKKDREKKWWYDFASREEIKLKPSMLCPINKCDLTMKVTRNTLKCNEVHRLSNEWYTTK